MARSALFSRRLGSAVRELEGALYGPHMAAAARAILDRLPLVDLVLEIRDARIPITSAFGFGSLKRWFGSSKHAVVLNKVDLADRSSTEEWMQHIIQQGCACYAVNAHKRDSIKELLGVVRDKVRELKSGEGSYTAMVMLVGIPNVGKSAIANSLHEIGRVRAEEKGNLRHAVVSTYPGETKDITAYKMHSHPSIYILDTPGILSPKFLPDDSASKLVLTGAIKDSTLQEAGLVEYLLSVLNLSEHKNWEDAHDIAELKSEKNRLQYPSDHTHDVIVKDVRRTLAKTRYSFDGDLEKENELKRLIESQLVALQEPFRLNHEKSRATASKLLDLYWTGRLGRYTLDAFSNDM